MTLDRAIEILEREFSEDAEGITNVDLLRRISQLEKIILGKSEQ